MSDPTTRLGDLLRDQREIRKVSLRHVAEEVGVSAPYLSDVEHNRRGVGEETAEKLARVLGLDPAHVKDLAAKARAARSLISLGHRCPRCGYPGPDERFGRMLGSRDGGRR